jgi:hypothetical protein
MFNAMTYIHKLEAEGIPRNQAEAQVQLVLDAVDGELVTKTEFNDFQQRIDDRFAQFDASMEQRFLLLEKRFLESQIQLTTRLGFLTISCTSIAVAVLTWLIKLH